jgi:hypothetical protein
VLAGIARLGQDSGRIGQIETENASEGLGESALLVAAAGNLLLAGLSVINNGQRVLLRRIATASAKNGNVVMHISNLAKLTNVGEAKLAADHLQQVDERGAFELSSFTFKADRQSLQRNNVQVRRAASNKDCWLSKRNVEAGQHRVADGPNHCHLGSGGSRRVLTNIVQGSLPIHYDS